MPATTDAGCRANVLAPSRVRRAAVSSTVAGVLMLACAAPLALASTGGVEAGSPTTPAATATPSTTTATSALPGPGAVQRALGIAVTHQWDHATKQAVRAFQRTHGLTPDGVVGRRTAAALGLDSPAATSSSSGHSAAASAELAKIATCESGANPTAVSSDGHYRGKYQFTRATWGSVGGHGDPAQAPESEQDARAAKLLARDGTVAWPTCA